MKVHTVFIILIIYKCIFYIDCYTISMSITLTNTEIHSVIL